MLATFRSDAAYHYLWGRMIFLGLNGAATSPEVAIKMVVIKNGAIQLT
jgi:hypothetical protein